MQFQTINPATDESVATFAFHDEAEQQKRLEQATATFQRYRHSALVERATLLLRLATLLEDERERLGRLITLEIGRPLSAAIAEIEKCAWVCRFYAERGEAILADESVPLEHAGATVRYAPLGVLLAIMPWNYPFWQVLRFAAPALMAGNVVLLKHAPSVPQCALEIEALLLRAGFPAGALQTLFVDVSTTQALIADPRVAAVTLTGSERAGQAVARATGQALKKTVLELGGSDPFIVLESADLDRAVESAVRARVVNSGQSCIAAKRFIVVEPVADAFTTRFVAAMAALRVGDPFDPDTELGPLATAAIRDTLVDQVQRACAHGARALTGGAPIPGPGYYYAPTVLTSITRDSPIFHEELFGPVALLFQAPDATAALRLANDTPFGLSSSVWTRNPQEQEQFVSELESGAVFINGMSVSDPRLPFGGVKRSGYGRELGVYGIREWVNVKSIVVTTP